MKKINLVLGILTIATIITGLHLLKKEFLDPSPTIITSTGPTIEQLQEMAELVSTRVVVSDILEGENSHFKGSWLIQGDALITTNLAAAQITDVDTSARTATLILPQPKIISARVDHENTRTHHVEKKQWFVNKDNESRLRDTAMRQAQKLIKKNASQPEHIQTAKDKAENTLRTFYRNIDWSVAIQWENRPLP